MPNVGDLNISLTLNITEFQKNSTAAQSHLQKLNSGMQKFGGVMKQHSGSILNFAAGIGVYNLALTASRKIILDSIKAWIEADSVNKKLLGALNNNVEAFKRLDEQAQKLQNLTIYDDETIKQSQTFLANQQRTEEQIKNIINVAVDYAAVTGKTLPDAVSELSGTLEGVTGRMGKLDSGITKLTKEQLANGDAITLIGNKYKGFAEIVGETTEGKLQRFNNQVNELQEQIGRGLIEGVVELTDDIGALTVGVEGNGKAWEIVKEEIGNAIKNYIKFGGVLPTAITLLAKFKDQLGSVRESLRAGATSIKDFLNSVSSMPSKIPFIGQFFDYAISKANEYLDKLLQLISAKDALTGGGAILDKQNYTRKGNQGNTDPTKSEAVKRTKGTGNQSVEEQIDQIEKLLTAIESEFKNKQLLKQLDAEFIKQLIDRIDAGKVYIKTIDDENKLLEKRAELLEELENFLPPGSVQPKIFERAQSDLAALEPGRSVSSKPSESPDEIKVKFENIVNDVSAIFKNNLIATLIGGADSFGAKFIGYFQDAISLVSSIVSIFTAIANISSGGVLSFLGFAEGGYTGKGGKYEPAGIVHKDEYVIPSNMLNPSLINFLEGIRTKRNPSSVHNAYANGGLVSGGFSNPNFKINVTNKGKLTEAIATEVVVLGTPGANIRSKAKGSRSVS